MASSKILFLFLILVTTFTLNVLIIVNGHQDASGQDLHDHNHGHHHDHDHHGHSHHHHENDEQPAFKYSREANEQIIKSKQTTQDFTVNVDNVWLSALLSTFIISIFPFFILFFIPLNNTSEHQSLLKILLSFASGGLLGDAFLHLIPHALLAAQSSDSHSHSHNHNHSNGDESGHVHDMSVGLWVLAGILAFLIIEKVIRIIKGPGHEHSHTLDVDLTNEPKKDKDEEIKEKGDKSKKKSKSPEKDSKDEHANVLSETTTVKKRVHFDKNVIEKDESKSKKSSDLKVAGYLNLAADFTHNLTDGLAIGASFLAGRNVGYITSLTILLHEIPHEIGDFAILIQSGCSKKKAMLLQLVTAFGALTGTLLSLLAEGMGDVAEAWILPFTAGGFIYIATVSVIPELLEGTSLKQSIIEILALVFGVLLMVLIAIYE